MLNDAPRRAKSAGRAIADGVAHGAIQNSVAVMTFANITRKPTGRLDRVLSLFLRCSIHML